MQAPAPEAEAPPESTQSTITRTAVSYARGGVGGLIVAMPLLMTMEMWWAGFFVPAWRILVLFVLNFGVLLILQHYSGLHFSKTIGAQVRAAIAAYGIGAVVGVIILFVFGVLRADLSLRDIAGMAILQTVPLSVGASIAMSHFGEENREAEARKDQAGFWGMKALALAGAVVFGFGIAPTEEPYLVGLQLEWWHALLLLLVSLAIVHGVVYAVDFKERSREEGLPKHVLVGHALTTYLVALVVAVYLLWTFGRLEPTTALHTVVYTTLALSAVTSLGAAAGELLI